MYMRSSVIVRASLTWEAVWRELSLIKAVTISRVFTGRVVTRKVKEIVSNMIVSLALFS